MSPSDDQSDDVVAQAEALAEDIAADLDSILLTHFPDAETLDTLRPGESDLALSAEVNRAVAKAMAAAGVEVFVQVADRAAFRRWIATAEDTPETRRRWVDRGRLLRGDAAFRLLGLKPPPAPPRPRFPAAPGPTADRLIAAFAAEDGFEFDGLLQDLLEAGREDVLDLALRKIATREGDDAAAEMETVMLAAAEGARIGPSGYAELVTLPVALPAQGVPDAEAMGDSLVRAGILEETLEVRFLPGWRSPEAVGGLSPSALRRLLLDLLAGAEPRDLPPADTDDLARRGFGVLVGVQIDWAIPTWEEIVEADGLPESLVEQGEETPEEARRTALFNGWRGATFEAHEGCVPLDLVPPSEVDAEIALFLDEAGAQTGGLEEIREFVAIARSEAGGEEVVCRAEVVGEGLELSLYTEAGRFLDSLSLSADSLPARAEEMPRVIQAFVRVVKDTPGR